MNRHDSTGDEASIPPLVPDTSHRPNSLAMTYPHELIQHIYTYLHPRDFNAARHTCHSWMTASLDEILLTSMLKRAGWSMKHEDYTWGLSCRLARECALGSGWTGNGITTPRMTSPFRQSAWVDFSELASGYASPSGRHSGGLVFTVSVCGKYLLVAEGGMIYVYELVGDSVKALTSVVCPRRVLAMSMDASSKRFAVAALLDGRMGLMCDLQIQRDKTDPPRASALLPGAILESSTGHRERDRNSLFSTRLYPEDDRLTLPQSSTLPHRRESQNHPSDFFSAGEYTNLSRRQPSDSLDSAYLSNPDPIELTASSPPIIFEDTPSRPSGRVQNYLTPAWSLSLSGFPYSSPPTCSPDNNIIKQGIPIETGPRSLYRHLCSDDDPPRSVAICPQRQCVAFGCSAGLELHWVDALTGQDLNRWFPLTGPSDFLYFLPPRHGIDSPRKLRLISSAAHPSQRSAICRRFYAAAKPMLSSFWSVVGFDASRPIQTYTATSTRGASRMIPWVSDCDHYRAVPLSDGFHILFADPESGMLCLGSDAPLGDPRRLLRKIMFVPPIQGAIPRIYAAGKDVVNGPRIVAAFEDTLVLYSVPPDIFALSKREQRATTPLNDGEIVDASPWINYWAESDIPTNYPRPAASTHVTVGSDIFVTTQGPKSIWPLFIRGQVIGEVDGLVDIAVNEADGLAIWGYGLDGRAKVWRIDNGRVQEGGIKVRAVERDGTVVEVPSVNVGGLGEVWGVDIPG